MIERLDHIVILVDDLAEGMESYTALGFTVTPGGEHAGGLTHNALVALEDGSYLELLAFRHPVASGEVPGGLSALTRRWLERAPAGEGLLDFALLPTEINADIAAAAERGLALEGPLPGGRRRPDGQEVAWSLGIPATPDLPFLCADLTPRELRVPCGAARKHANGAVGVAGVSVVVRDLDASVERYRALLGREPKPGTAASSPGARIAVFALDGPSITLAEPDASDKALRKQLGTRGEGPYEVTLHQQVNAGVLAPKLLITER
ncbi:MAG: VOC family protein [Chloroflexia bacterium]